MNWKIGAALVTLVCLLGGALFGFVHIFYWSPASNSTEVVLYEVASGTSAATISKDLEGKGVVKDAHLFLLVMKILGVVPKLKVGDYSFRQDMTPEEVIEILTSGKSVGRNFTVSEGLNIFEIAELYESGGFGTKAEFLAAAKDSNRIRELLGSDEVSFEGYLYPETYQITKYMRPQALISKMVGKFLEVYKTVEPFEARLNMTRKEIVTLASIVEKETGAPQERPMISAVFHNRLKLGMKLQTDPTIIYGKALELGRVVIDITRKDLLEPHPFNTYHIKGLPPSPIANPGKASLAAAVQPAASRYLYFVSQNNGTHIFSETYEGHLLAVKKHQLDPKSREGKSWRDLNKNQ